MNTQAVINTGVIIAMIALFGYVGVEGKEPTHYCESRELTAHCYDLSSTMGTCYTLPAKTGGKRCSEGWKEIPLPSKAETYSYGSGKKWLCDQNKCTKID